MVFLKLLISTIIAYFLLLLMTRLIGRKTISQMTFFDFTVGVTLGTITGNIALGKNNTSTSAAVVLIVISILAVSANYFSTKSFSFRKIAASEPVVVIENGKIIYENMKKIKFTVNELMMQLRQKNIFNIADVEMAVMEMNGKLSVLPKSQKQPLTPSDLNIQTIYKGFTKDLIIDGNIMHENLKDAKLDENWLKEELQKQNISDINDVFYAGLDTSGNLYVSTKEQEEEHNGKHGIE